MRPAGNLNLCREIKSARNSKNKDKHKDFFLF